MVPMRSTETVGLLSRETGTLKGTLKKNHPSRMQMQAASESGEGGLEDACSADASPVKSRVDLGSHDDGAFAQPFVMAPLVTSDMAYLKVTRAKTELAVGRTHQPESLQPAIQASAYDPASSAGGTSQHPI